MPARPPTVRTDKCIRASSSLIFLPNAIFRHPMQQDPKRNTRPDARNAKIASQNPKQHNSPADCSNPLLCTQDTLFYEGTLCKCTHITASEYCKYFLHFCGSTDNTCYKVIVAADLLCPLRSMYSTKPFDNQHQNLNIPAES